MTTRNGSAAANGGNREFSPLNGLCKPVHSPCWVDWQVVEEPAVQQAAEAFPTEGTLPAEVSSVHSSPGGLSRLLASLAGMIDWSVRWEFVLVGIAVLILALVAKASMG